MKKRSSKSDVNKIDEITPCALFTDSVQTRLEHIPHKAGVEDARQFRTSSPSSCGNCSGTSTPNHVAESRRNSIRTLEEGTDGDPERLWMRMLALQQMHGCYKSARMSAALELRDASFLLPSKACLDLMNDDLNALPTNIKVLERIVKEPIWISKPKT